MHVVNYSSSNLGLLTYLGLGGFGHLKGRGRSVDADSRAESSSGGDEEEGVGKLHGC